MRPEVGHGFEYQLSDGAVLYGLVIGIEDNKVEFVQVHPIYKDGRDHIVCYDDFDAVEDKHKDNVRLTSCPPPFSDLGFVVNRNGEKVSNAVAMADMNHVKSLSADFFDRNICVIMDGGAKVSDFDISTVYSHPWASRMHRELVLKDYTELNKDETVGLSKRADRRLPDIPSGVSFDGLGLGD